MSQEPHSTNRHTPPLPNWVAWLAHIYTGLGLLLAVGMTVAIIDGSPRSFRIAFGLMVVACLVDASDGSLARRLRVKERLPQFDGAKLDDLIDFLTFTSLPLLLVWRADLLPEGGEWSLVVAMVASAYGFCQVPAKTADGNFVGFPSYWNIVAFYLYTLDLPGWLATAIVLALSALTFVPSYYLYPSRGGTLSRLTNFLGGVWVVLLVAVLLAIPNGDARPDDPAGQRAFLLAIISLFYPAYYMLVSWGLSFDRWRRTRS